MRSLDSARDKVMLSSGDLPERGNERETREERDGVRWERKWKQVGNSVERKRACVFDLWRLSTAYTGTGSAGDNNEC